MKWKRIIGLAVLLVATAYFFQGKKLSDQKIVDKKATFQNRLPAAVPKQIIKIVKPTHDLNQSGLTKEKIEAIVQLRDFHASHPAFTEENILKRQAMLEVLVKNPRETVTGFSKIMRESKDDGLKSFLLNLTMNSKLEDDEKAEIFVARLKTGASFSKDGLVPDEQISFMIGMSHLSRLESESAKDEAKERLKEDQALIRNAGFRSIYKDYFHETI